MAKELFWWSRDLAESSYLVIKILDHSANQRGVAI